MRSRRPALMFPALLVTLVLAAACGSSDPATVAADAPAGSPPTGGNAEPDGSAPVPVTDPPPSTTTAASTGSTAPGPGPAATVPSSTPPTTAPSGGVPAVDGIVTVRLEKVGGVFVEGFEVGLRFEDANGKRLGTTLWSDFIRSLDGEQTLDRWYDSVLEQVVPAGTVVVLAEANVGTGPGPSVPDVDGALPCRLVLDVPAGNRVQVEVSFDGTDRCLRQLP